MQDLNNFIETFIPNLAFICKSITLHHSIILILASITILISVLIFNNKERKEITEIIKYKYFRGGLITSVIFIFLLYCSWISINETSNLIIQIAKGCNVKSNSDCNANLELARKNINSLAIISLFLILSTAVIASIKNINKNEKKEDGKDKLEQNNSDNYYLRINETYFSIVAIKEDKIKEAINKRMKNINSDIEIEEIGLASIYRYDFSYVIEKCPVSMIIKRLSFSESKILISFISVKSNKYNQVIIDDEIYKKNLHLISSIYQ